MTERCDVVVTLSATQGGGLTVRAEEDAGEDNFDMPCSDEGGRFFNCIVDRFTPQRWAERGDDAVGAVGVAAVLDFEEGALMMRLPLAEQWERGCADRVRF